MNFYVICSGFHSSNLTIEFYHYFTTIIDDIDNDNTILVNFDDKTVQIDRTFYENLVNIPPYDGYKLYQYLQKKYSNLSLYNLTFIAFSAGVIGAIIAGNLWEKNGGKVNKLLAFDSWGVPLIGNFPCYRISHDYITHFSYLGGEKNAFYCSPEVSHLQLWQNPQQIKGWWQMGLGIKTKSNLSEFLVYCLCF